MMNSWGVKSWCAVVGAIVLLGASPVRAAVLQAPELSCGMSTDVTLDVEVCAGIVGPYGAPAGFSLQWMKLSDYNENGGWADSEDPRFCKASFSGVPCTRRTAGSDACVNRFSLDPGSCTTVNVGNLIDEEVGLSSNCLEILSCGTEYVFRAFAHAHRTYKRSPFTANLVCGTSDCTPPPNCTYSYGFWKTHNDGVCETNPGSPLCVHWPVNTLTLGNVEYSQAQLRSILAAPAAGNGLIILAHQLIAAKLNIANGASSAGIETAIANADAAIGDLVVPPVGADSLTPGSVSGLSTALDHYNTGATGPGHCE